MAEESFSKSRRKFLKSSLTGATALTILPSAVISGMGHTVPSDKLNIAAVGVGGVGYQNLLNLEQENIAALCDIDRNYAEKSFRRWSRAKTYTDFREMLEKEKGIDAVLIATPDHSHAIIALSAIQLQKHVFVQAPMAHAIYDTKRITDSAAIYNVATQVGNHVSSGDNTRDIAEAVWSGAIGSVRTVQAWTNAPQWKQGFPTMPEEMRTPNNLNWSLFLGPSAQIPYNEKYTPFGWRAWWQFGNGTLGYIASQLLEPVFRSFKLQAPVSVLAGSSDVNLYSAPLAQKINFTFARRNNLPQLAMPELELNWYDGGLIPVLNEHLPSNILESYEQGGLIFEGEKGVLICGPGGDNFSVFMNRTKVSIETGRVLHRVEGGLNGHEKDWVRACKESAANRLAASASFESQKTLTETLLVGSMAVRLQSLKRKLVWDSLQMHFTNVSSYDEIAIVNNKTYSIQNGLARTSASVQKYNAEQFINETVRPVSRNGWIQL
ncbi:MAG: Gfo/Idh/MocA family oxidoreductase [Prolixibacteraceae bacterium]|jgi:hypothetical protein|nr:Gfo/Idh/MocA family oxidoreductase [Prolixibacteraceae bacterium]